MFDKKFLPYLYIGLVGLVVSAAYIFAINPEEDFMLSDFSLSPIPFLFFLLYLSVTGIFIFFLGNIRRGILGGSFLLGVLLLQFFDYRNILYPLLLLGIFILIEVLYFKRK